MHTKKYLSRPLLSLCIFRKYICNELTTSLDVYCYSGSLVYSTLAGCAPFRRDPYTLVYVCTSMIFVQTCCSNTNEIKMMVLFYGPHDTLPCVLILCHKSMLNIMSLFKLWNSFLNSSVDSASTILLGKVSSSCSLHSEKNNFAKILLK